MIKHGGINNLTLDFALMWTPGIIGLFCSFIWGNGISDIGFKVGKLKYYLYSYAIPTYTAILIFLLLLIFRIDTFEISPHLLKNSESLLNIISKFIFKGIIFGGLLGIISGLGEEIGWRGFLHSKMIESKIRHPYLITGVIWGFWHSPLILFSNYSTSSYPLLSFILFLLMTIGMSVYMGWIRQASGSVLTAALIHGTHNLWIQAIYPSFLKQGKLDVYFGGESGLFIVVIYSVLAYLIYKRIFQNMDNPKKISFSFGL
jgi:membrane protease YdiL (CAAX protease family)